MENSVQDLISMWMIQYKISSIWRRFSATLSQQGGIQSNISSPFWSLHLNHTGFIVYTLHMPLSPAVIMAVTDGGTVRVYMRSSNVGCE